MTFNISESSEMLREFCKATQPTVETVFDLAYAAAVADHSGYMATWSAKHAELFSATKAAYTNHQIGNLLIEAMKKAGAAIDREQRGYANDEVVTDEH